MSRMPTRSLLIASLVVLTLAACGEDGGKDKGRDKDLTEGLEEFEPYKFSELELPYETPEQCIEHAETELDDTTDEIACLCEKCLELMQECDALAGCVEIRECVRTSGCTNEFSCYLIPGAPCQETIDKWGNASLATTVSVGLMDCRTAEQCR
jgi:hypothetical protein